MDYLIETMEKWEQVKKTNDPRVPNHQVVIEAMGGASAGGMMAAIGLLALQHKLPSVTDPDSGKETGNLLFDTWVNLVDDGKQKTLKKMFDLGDISKVKGVPSLLNSKPIDDLARKAIQVKPGKLPAYVSDDLDLLLTLCNLRGIPVKIEFSANQDLIEPPSHKISLHRMLAHFRLKLSEADRGKYLPLDLGNRSDIELLAECAKATGAFPIGLQSRLIQHEYITDEYIKASSLRYLRADEWDEEINLKWGDIRDPFITQVVDGGTTNNEPFGETAQVLMEKVARKDDSIDPAFKNYGLIMIDPFPNFVDNTAYYNPPEALKQLVGPIINALRQQALFKDQDFMDSLRGDYPRGLIFPVRWKKPGLAYEHPIASSALDGFGGLFARQFRVHDFLLGRWNCRNFLRYFFCFPESDQLHPIHRTWTNEMKDAFRFSRKSTGKNYFPIIPDMSQLEKRTGKEPKYFEYDFDFPQISVQELMDYKPLIEKRLTAVLKHVQYPESTSRRKSAAAEYIADQYRKNWFGRNITGPIQNRVINKRVLPGLASMLTQQTLQAILSDFHKRGLVEL